MPFSRIAMSIGESVTLKLNAEAARMRADGEPVIHLGGGEPKSLAPASAREANTGSTTQAIKCAARMASNALPPSLKINSAALAVSGWPQATAPRGFILIL